MLNFLKRGKNMATATQFSTSDTVKSSSNTQSSDIIKVSPEELIKRMVSLNPNIVGKLPEKRIQALVRNTLMALAQEVNECQEGRLQIQGLGRITIRQVEVEKDGSPATVKRVLLNPAKPKAKE